MGWPELSKCHCSNQQYLVNSLLSYMASLESSQELGRLCKLNCHSVKSTRHGLVYMCIRLPWSCAAPAGMLSLIDCRDALQTAGIVCKDACMQHCMERFWSIHESQYSCSLPWAMLAVYSGCKQFAAMHECYALSTVACDSILVNALQQSMNPIEWYL